MHTFEIMKSLISISLVLLQFTVNAQWFNDAEKKIIMSGDTTSMLRVIPITEPAGAKALRTTSTDISYNDPLLSILKNRMLQSVLDTNHRGVGIAAPQVGINRNLIWVQRFDKPNKPFKFFINPKVVWRSTLLSKGAEGDLSFVEQGEVIRSYAIMISYTDENGKQQLEMLEDFTAIIFQHETDHLFGILLTDRIKEQSNKTYEAFQPLRSQALLKEKINH